MDAQLHQMREQGLREFFIFPIYGLDVEYMSPDYLDGIGLVVKWCREHWMRVWVYDELSWPSGTAAGLVPRKHPDAIASQLRAEDHPEISAADVEALLGDSSVYGVVEIRPDGAFIPVTKELLRSETPPACRGFQAEKAPGGQHHSPRLYLDQERPRPTGPAFDKSGKGLHR